MGVPRHVYDTFIRTTPEPGASNRSRLVLCRPVRLSAVVKGHRLYRLSREHNCRVPGFVQGSRE
jgi:hypothetical protein